MANTQQIKTAESRKAARKAAQAKAVVQADAEARVRKADVPPKAPAPPAMTKAQKRLADKAKAEAQAEKDSALRPGPNESESVPLDPSKPLTMHQLNARAKFVNRTQRDMARDAAAAAGKAAFDVLTERRNKGKMVDPVSRRQTVAMAQGEMARMLAQQNAAREQEVQK